MSKSRAFTVPEMLAVVAIIFILVALLLPTLGRSREAARKVQCASNQHQLIIAARSYAIDNNRFLPPAKRDDGNESTQHIHTNTYKSFTSLYQFTQDGLSCPNMTDWIRFEPGTGGVRLGLQALFGFTVNQNIAAYPWNSPKRLGVPADLEMTADVVILQVVNPNITVGGHGKKGGQIRGPVGSPIEPINLGVQGSNVGMIDGSVIWRAVADLKKHRNLGSNTTQHGYW